jgi:preprotein translocase subunit SecF
MRTPRIDVVGRSRQWAAISLALVALSAAALGVRGLELSIDFVGGNSYQLVDVRQDLTAEDLRDRRGGRGPSTSSPSSRPRGRPPPARWCARARSIRAATSREVRTALVEVSEADDVGFEFVGPVWGERITEADAAGAARVPGRHHHLHLVPPRVPYGVGGAASPSPTTWSSRSASTPWSASASRRRP